MADQMGDHMRFLAVAGLAAALSISTAPSAMVLAAAPVGATEAHRAAALDLARLINESNQLEKQVDRMLAGIAAQGFSSDPNLIALQQEYPGADRIFVDAMRPIMMSELALMMPEYNQAIADFFFDRFTQAEIGELAVFWRSDAGQALLRSVSSNVDFAATAKEVVAQMENEGPFAISREAVDADKKKAVASGVNALVSQHRVAVMRFGLTPVGRKMAKFVEQKNEIDQKWANRAVSPEAEARIEREVGGALLAFIEEEDRKRAAAQ
ncbi:hypothetical protein [Sphingopyxis sp. H115]|uniref:hypothetical protein n=1 Tax=Sphingopyxis sp. H115 TaxID=1759073 RepID=UPI00136641B5|nr:hypothetical protein [Sphingopyxis sp. H115]